MQEESREVSSSTDSPTCTARVCLDLTDFECSLCFRVYNHPTTIPCGISLLITMLNTPLSSLRSLKKGNCAQRLLLELGHTFCKACILAASQKSSTCPLCRAKYATKVFPINVTIDRIIEKNFPEKYSATRRESKRGSTTKTVVIDSDCNDVDSPGLWDCFLCF